jgi:signal transduction histidine kinase
MKPNSWLNKLAQASFDIEDDEAREEHITRVILLMISGTVLCFTPIILLVLFADPGPFDWVSTGYLALLTIPVIIAWVLIQHGHWKIARHIPVLIFLTIGFLGIYNNSLATTFILFLVLAIFLSGIYYCRGTQLIILLGIIISTIGISWITTQNFDLTLTGGIPFTGLMIGIWLLQLFSNNLLTKSLQHQKDLTSQLRVEVNERLKAERKMAEINLSLEKRVSERTGQLAAANQELQSLAYSIAHDLRAPIRAIIGLNEMIISEHDDAGDENILGYLEKTISAGTRMDLMLDGLLNLLSLNEVELSISEVDLGEIAENIFNDLTRELNIQNASLDVRDSPNAQADPALMLELLTQLITNALKFAKPDSPIRLEFGFHDAAAEPAYYLKDNGIGFDMQYSEKVFDPFISLNVGDENPGDGIGLSIARRIIKLHQGKIWVESAETQGATFYFTV